MSTKINRIPKKCPICSTVFLVLPAQVNTRINCSKSCSGKWTLSRLPRTQSWKDNISKALTGIKRSEETIEKMRERSTGVKQSPEQIARRVLKNTGKKRTKKTRERMSRSALLTFKNGRKACSGEKHPRWKGGVTPENIKIRTSAEMARWRKEVYKRDNYTCVFCGDNSGGNLNADHIKKFSDFPELRFDVSNGRTLCVPCHKQTPTYGNRPKDSKGEFLGTSDK